MPSFLGNIIENLFGKPATVKYPFEKPEPVPGTRGELNFNMAKCDHVRTVKGLVQAQPSRSTPRKNGSSGTASSASTVTHVSEHVCMKLSSH